MLATVRNRRGIISAVEPFDGNDGRLHLVTVEYTDAESPAEDQLIWEREPFAKLLEATALPDPTRDAPMVPEEFDALVRATRWTALSPFLDPDGSEGPLTRFPIASPFHGAIQVDDFQLVPLLKALQMPRVSLLIADDVGLGKTVEAGLILAELLLRRRIRRVLVICPASLCDQWQQEMRDKFALSFDTVNRESTHALRKRLGLDANPWRTFPRIVTSYYYLKQADVLEEFRAACRTPEGSPHLPWDLLIVDEAHNLTPAAYGEDSDLAKMLGQLTPFFEHRLFLTATPHNGHTRSFTGLLERLDPVRFSQTDEIRSGERAQIEQVVIRRLKSEINARSNPKRFCERIPAEIPLRLSAEERQLAEAFQEFRTKVRSLIASRKRTEQLAGAFAVEILGKRLLSSPVAFADSWHRYRQGLAEAEAAEAAEVRAAERALREDTGDDREAEGRANHAAKTVGAWLKPLAERLAEECEAIDQALDALSLGRADVTPENRRPSHDVRFEALCKLIDERIRIGNDWRVDERLIVFTEYKTTLDYLKARLRVRYPEAGRIRVLYGSMNDPQEGTRQDLISRFNDPRDPVRVLIATDAASEGLNLQETARYVWHIDVPWNPARIEQRNGRLDRHGQARDVTAFHFTSDDEADLKFLGYVVNKVHTIREDLGSVGEVFDAAFQRRLIEGDDAGTVLQSLDERLTLVRGRAAIPRNAQLTTATTEAGATGEDEAVRLKALAGELDLDPTTLRETLEVALGIGVGRPRFESPDEHGRVRLRQPLPAGWVGLIDDTLRLDGRNGQIGALPALVFDPLFYIETQNGRPVFRPRRDTTLLHLAHPLFHRALASFARARFPGGADHTVSRWVVRRGPIPDQAEALLLLTVEELAVNDLRESFHHWVRTIAIPVGKRGLGRPLPHQPASYYRQTGRPASSEDTEQAKEIWDDIGRDVRELIQTLSAELTSRLAQALRDEFQDARKREIDRFQSRQGEVSALIEQQTLARLEREIEALQAERSQGLLFDADRRLDELVRSEEEKREELTRRRIHYEELRRQLAKERDRVIEHLLPKRYAMRGDAQVLPVAVEIRLPGEPA